MYGNNAVRRKTGPSFWTGPRVSFCAILFSCWLFVFISGGRIPYGVFWVMALVPGFALLYAAVASLQLGARISVERAAAQRGQTVPLECRLKNRGPLALWWAEISLAEHKDLITMERRHTFDMLPFESLRLRRDITPRHRGEYILGVDSLMAGDLFNIIHIPARRPSPASLVVYPRVPDVFPEWKKRIDSLSSGTLSSSSPDEPSVDSRAYRYGDSMRRIHWNLTARKMDLMTRMGETLFEQKLFCVLDLSPFEADSPLDCEDALIERCLSAIRYSCRRQIDTTLLYGDGGGIVSMSGRSESFYSQTLEALTRARFSSRVAVPELLARASRARVVMFFTMGVPDRRLMDMFPRGGEAQICAVVTRGKPDPAWDAQDTGRVRITLIEPESPPGADGGTP